MSNTFNLIPEIEFSSAPEHADLIINEAFNIFNLNGWKIEKNKNILVESIKVSGDLESSNILLMRSRGVIDKNANDVFSLLVSPEGFAILDPVSDPEDHKKPVIEEYEWKASSRLEAATAAVNIPIMPKAEFIVLNAIDNTNNIFVSKSIIHKKHPGSSVYYSGDSPSAINNAGGKIRAFNSMAIYVKPIDDNTSELLIYNYVDMCIKKGKMAWLYNFINRNFFDKIYIKTEEYFCV